MLPPVLIRNVTNIWGDLGRRWLDGLPALIADVLNDWQLQHDWQLQPEGSFALSINWVAAVQRADGSSAVLKLGLPTSGHLSREATALEFFDARAAVALLARDDARGALLLERARPGTPVSRLVPAHDEQATAVLIEVMRRLHEPAPADVALPDLLERGASFTRYLRDNPSGGPLPRHLVERARLLLEELCATATEHVVLHGDLHHDNVLSADREGWLAIDPHGVVGDPGYDLGALLYNPDPTDDTIMKRLPARVEQLADGLAMPIERVAAWGFVQAVLSEVWTAEGVGAITGRPLEVALALLPDLP